MPQVTVFDMTGKSVGEMTLSDAIFGIEPNTSVMHAAVVNYLANQRQGTQSTLTRSEVSGGGRKPWKQKGTGRARQGSTRAPQWTHGGIALGPKPRDYSYELPKKVKRLALISAFSTKVADNDLIVVDNIAVEGFKTKAVVEMLSKLGADKKALIVMPELDQKLIKSAANIPGVKTALVNTINVYDILNYDKFIVAKGALEKIEVITEASMQGIANKKYTFKVAKDANKIEIAKAVAELFGVKVAKVNTMNVNGRYRRQGLNGGYTADWKKAIVTLTEDSKSIEFFDSMM